MKLLVNGSSISRGPLSWPYRVQQALDCDMVNLSMAGSGNTYIHEATVSELAQRKYDLVLLQWAPFTRFDFKVKDIGLFKNTIYTSDCQIKQNDWPEKQVYPVNDQDYAEPDWVFGCGYGNQDKDPNLVRAFEGFYHFAKPNEYMYHTLMKMISMQSYLKVNNIPYLFCFGRPFLYLEKHQHLTNQLDHDMMFTEQYLLGLAKEYDWFEDDGAHPNAEAYECFAQALTEKIKCTHQLK
jgi:hypothetical protein